MNYMRSSVSDEYKIRDLQNCLLQIAMYIDHFCDKYNIMYFLMGGSALGAVRHQGFIPWDDDLDVFMRPSDFARFRECFEKYGDQKVFYLQLLSENDGMIVSAKLRMNQTAYIEKATKEWKIHQGIFVDIFILHNTPDTPVFRVFQCLAAKYILSKGQSEKQINYRGWKKILMSVMNLLPRNFLFKNSLKVLYNFDSKITKNVCHFMGKAIYKKAIYPNSYFESSKKIPFENTFLNVPQDVTEYLKSRFGDYMVLPERNSRKNSMHALLWDDKNDFSKYVNESREFFDEKRLV